MPKEKNVFFAGDFVYSTFHQNHEIFCLKFVVASKIYEAGQPARYRLELAHPIKCRMCGELATGELDGQHGCGECIAKELELRANRNLKRGPAGQELLGVEVTEVHQEGFSDYLILKPLIEGGELKNLNFPRVLEKDLISCSLKVIFFKWLSKE